MVVPVKEDHLTRAKDEEECIDKFRNFGVYKQSNPETTRTRSEGIARFGDEKGLEPHEDPADVTIDNLRKVETEEA